MTRWGTVIVCASTACVPLRGELVSSVDLLTSTVPLAPGTYTVGEWVTAKGCDYVDTDFSVADLIAEARGDADALIDVTVEHLVEVTYARNPNGVVVVSPANAFCYRVRGRAVHLLPEHAPAIEPAAIPAAPPPDAVAAPAPRPAPRPAGVLTVRMDPGKYTAVTVNCADGTHETASFDSGVALVTGLPPGASCVAYFVGGTTLANVDVTVGSDLTCTRGPPLACEASSH